MRGEGCGVVVLKRLSDALRDGNRVLAVVRGSALNQDGRSNGLMAPNPAAQRDVLRAACAQCGRAATPGGLCRDPWNRNTCWAIPSRRVRWATVLGRGRPENSRAASAPVKSNLGHLEAAAGIAGFIKAVLVVQQGQIPPNLNFRGPESTHPRSTCD